MVPAFFRNHNLVQSDRFFGRNLDIDLDEMVPLTEVANDDDDNETWKTEQNGITTTTDPPRKAKPRKGLANHDEFKSQGSLEMEVTGVDAETGSVNFEPVSPTKTLKAGLHQLLLPAAAIASDIAHYPVLFTERHGPTLDDLVREDIPLRTEKLRAVALQILIPFLVAGLGMVAAGMVLDIVQVGSFSINFQLMRILT